MMTFKETFPDHLKMNPLENIFKQYYSHFPERSLQLPHTSESTVISPCRFQFMIPDLFPIHIKIELSKPADLCHGAFHCFFDIEFFSCIKRSCSLFGVLLRKQSAPHHRILCIFLCPGRNLSAYNSTLKAHDADWGTVHTAS